MPGLTNAYSISKAALNMYVFYKFRHWKQFKVIYLPRVARKYGAVLKSEGINTVVIHPGWVLTDIGEGIEGWMKTYTSMKPISLEESAVGVIKAIENVKSEDGVTFVNWEGKRLPW